MLLSDEIIKFGDGKSFLMEIIIKTYQIDIKDYGKNFILLEVAIYNH